MSVEETNIPALAFGPDGLIPAIVQDRDTGAVLMMAYMNGEALQKTLQTRQTWFWSRSRQALWHKGATSGDTQAVCDIRVDCDQDCLLVLVTTATGKACHTGRPGCFYRSLSDDGTKLHPVKG